MEHEPASQACHGHGDGVGVGGPVGLVELHPMPDYLRLLEELVQSQSGVIPGNVALQAGRDQTPDKPEQAGMFIDKVPVEPADLVVLTVGVVVALLCPPAPRRPSGASALLRQAG